MALPASVRMNAIGSEYFFSAGSFCGTEAISPACCTLSCGESGRAAMDGIAGRGKLTAGMLGNVLVGTAAPDFCTDRIKNGLWERTASENTTLFSCISPSASAGSVDASIFSCTICGVSADTCSTRLTAASWLRYQLPPKAKQNSTTDKAITLPHLSPYTFLSSKTFHPFLLQVDAIAHLSFDLVVDRIHLDRCDGNQRIFCTKVLQERECICIRPPNRQYVG